MATDPRVPVAVFTITQNAADCAGLTIREMCSRFQEVNVVVGPSDDTTEAIVYSLEEEFEGTLRVQFHEFDTHAGQYQRALDMCSDRFGWVLQLSSDELLPPGINWQSVFTNKNYDAYRLPRYFIVHSLGHYNKHAYPDSGIRLVRYGKGFIEQVEIHESFQLTAKNRTGKIRNVAEHILDIGDIRAAKQLAMKGESRFRWYAGDIYNREFFKKAKCNMRNTFLIRKAECAERGAEPLPDEYRDYLESVIPHGHIIRKELPCNQSESP